MSELTRFPAEDGEPIHVAIDGHGPPLLMLHGWTASHREWDPFLEALTPRHRVLRWDARGHGGHRLVTGHMPTVARMAQDLHDLIEHHGLRDVVAVGHSMGALTLWEYVRRHGTGALARLCLIDQSPRLLTDHDWEHGIYGDFDRARAAAFEEELERDFAEAVLRLAALGLNERARAKYAENARGWQQMRAALQGLDPRPLIECWKSLTAADYRDVLERIDIPALLVFGAQSNFYRSDTARLVRDRMPNAVLHIYPDTDHSPHQWQRARFAADLLAFVDGG